MWVQGSNAVRLSLSNFSQVMHIQFDPERPKVYSVKFDCFCNHTERLVRLVVLPLPKLMAELFKFSGQFSHGRDFKGPCFETPLSRIYLKAKITQQAISLSSQSPGSA